MVTRRVVDGVEMNVEIVDGKEVLTAVKKDDKPVTQEAIDRIFKQMREGEEKAERIETELRTQLSDSEKGKVDLVDRIKVLETGAPPPPLPAGQQKYGQQADGSWVFPKNDAEWDDLIAEQPTFGVDLRRTYHDFSKQYEGKAKDIQVAQKESALKVANKILPEMYKKDAEGKLVLDENGHPVFDENSDVFKIFSQIAQEEGVDAQGRPVIFATKNGPELIALKVKDIQGTDREKELKAKAEAEGKLTEDKRNKGIKDGKTAPPGQAPPPPPKVEVSFTSEFERERAQKKVDEGLYKDLEDYCRTRDGKVVAYGRGGV